MWRKSSSQFNIKKFAQFDLLPDEILLNILLQPVLDLKSLATITAVSKRFYHLGLHVIICNYLKTIQLSTLIDQEGHGQFTTSYTFDAFDEKMMSATFKSIYPKSKRYYSSKESPTLRYASIDYQLDSDTKLTGLETLKYNNITRIFPFSNHPIHKNMSVAERRFSWEFSYQITKLKNNNGSDTKNEYYLTPLQLTLHINHLIKLESNNEKFNKKIKKWMNSFIHS
ncbi:hypothetical protein K501DRAFT_195622 [Backusella circina FSU 941]|nr:hypothetical protein K501DRAFT_195622 [Backusella circina FSU 941]